MEASTDGTLLPKAPSTPTPRSDPTKIFSLYFHSDPSSTFAIGSSHSSTTLANPLPTSFAPHFATHLPASMGQSKSHVWPSSLRPSTSSTSSRRRTLSSPFPPAPTPPAKAIPADNIFVPIQPDDVLGQIPIHTKHPVPRKTIEDSADKPIQTNGFYTNVFVGLQDQPVWTQPYFIWWGKGGSDPTQFATWGMNVGHVESGDLQFGPGDPPKYYIAPRLQSLILGARELDGETVMTTDTHLPFSVNINLRRGTAPSSPKITFPVVQGMGLFTACYYNATPMVQTAGKGFRDIGSPIQVGRSTKYHIKDCNERIWFLYINPANGVDYDATKLKTIDPNSFLLPSGFVGTIQVAKCSGQDSEGLYDKAQGTFVTEAKLYATVSDASGTYGFSYTKIGTGPLLMFFLPHHIQSLDPELKPSVTTLQLQTTTKGKATAVWVPNDSISFVESNLPTSMSFAPWMPGTSTARTRFSSDFLHFLPPIAELDLRRAMSEPTPQDSYYYAGKSLARFATLLWVINNVLSRAEWVAQGLDKLKQEMARYIDNVAKYPLYYDDTWKGLVSRAGLDGDPGLDFGNTFYNDHHFHFGYFIYTAAVIGYLDPTWLAQGDNKKFVNMMVKDIAESEYEGRDFPFQRCFDWYNGHSWAKGLFQSRDGKDEESTSEDGFASYAIKMWGKVTGDANMEKRGNLMLAVQARSFNNYFYLLSTNTNHPARYIPHKVPGITFENKVDYATYFGDAPHLVHGIHMLPLAPPSAYLRPRAFVREEWDAFFGTAPAPLSPPIASSPSSPASRSPTSPPTTPKAGPASPKGNTASTGDPYVEGGWRGILFANLALVDAKRAYAFFRNGVGGVWDDGWIDAGATRTWYLVWSASLGGVKESREGARSRG